MGRCYRRCHLIGFFLFRGIDDHTCIRRKFGKETMFAGGGGIGGICMGTKFPCFHNSASLLIELNEFREYLMV